MAGLGNFMQDVLWCFSQVKGTIDIGVAEGNLDPIPLLLTLPVEAMGLHFGQWAW
uniref:Uncharacterized protein n=1 Tax=Amazona collaria TaxID=241587 RepID=A0A8B9G8X7_9PSIT